MFWLYIGGIEIAYLADPWVLPINIVML